MKKPLIIIPLALLLCFMIGCQDKAVREELEVFKAQAEVEEQNKECDVSARFGHDPPLVSELHLSRSIVKHGFITLHKAGNNCMALTCHHNRLTALTCSLYSIPAT